MQSVLSQIGQAAKLEPGKGTALWKPRFDNLVITSEATLRQKTNYIHHNTVCKGFVNEPWQWHYSSASCYAGMAGIDVPVDNQWACLGYGDIPSGKDS
jgi:hypothetical protein